ncbi:Protein of unknown function DUF2305 [Carpediemonas membranifera]|uniref:Uncharacterized protein n=1 Tax=Carpediemonas membranifera TaxID=201153 RepID=A0A8J6B643_9EUKA|nr:Protein of unknown function DUF2305 [Carpediemonas membranifera]|eukprot:KAG9393632.1 Protein of unknown function DUF2305 [Carpediemonas membranifera]
MPANSTREASTAGIDAAPGSKSAFKQKKPVAASQNTIPLWEPNDFFRMIDEVDVLDFSSLADDAAPVTDVLFFSPGNPGIVNFYELFLEDLQRRLSTKGVRVFGSSHLGHNLGIITESTRNYHIDLGDIISNKLSIIEAILRECVPRWTTAPTVAVSLLSHSMGCYVNLSVVTRLTALLETLSADLGVTFKLSHNVLLHPAIMEVRAGCSGPLLWAENALLRTLMSLAARSTLKVLPSETRLQLAVKALNSTHESAAASKYNRHSIGVTARMLMQPRSISNILHLIHNEIDEINQLPSAQLEAALAVCRHTFLYSAHDKWATQTHRAGVDQVIAQTAGDQAMTFGAEQALGRDIPHQFCTDDDATSRLVRFVMDRLDLG